MLGSNGQIELEEVEQGEYLFPGHPLHTCIRVTTLANLPIFAKEAIGVAEQLKDELKDQEEEMYRKVVQRL